MKLYKEILAISDTTIQIAILNPDILKLRRLC